MKRSLPPMNASTAALNPKVSAKPSAATRGASARRAGASFEGAIEDELDALVLAGRVAHYLRIDARKIESKGVVKARIPSACDFVGVLPGAVAFCIEAKSTADGDVWATEAHAEAARRGRDPALTDNQRAQLNAYVAVGAVAILAVRKGGRAEFVRWGDVRAGSDGRLAWERSVRSVREALSQPRAMRDRDTSPDASRK